VRRHFRFEAKLSETEAKFFSLWCEKSAFFTCFASMRNVEICSKTKMGTKRKQNEKEAKNWHYFRFKAKWSETEAKNCNPFASKRNEAKRKEKTAIIFALKRNGSEIFFASMRKMKWSENKTKKKRKHQSKKG
jgi:hypothetical protein